MPVQQGINFKIFFFTFKCLHGQAPKYLQHLLTWSQPKGLQSDNKLLLVVPKSKQVTHGDCAFSIAAPRLWNALPNYIKLSVNIEVFKCHLKTHVLHLCSQFFQIFIIVINVFLAIVKRF